MIDCANYDYIEIACMHQYWVTLTLRNQSSLTGVAIDTLINQNKKECIKLLSEDQYIEVVLDHIATLTAVSKNPHFSQIIFKL